MKAVKYITPKSNQFSEIYLAVREKEQRLYNDEIVENLPIVPKDHLYKKEWSLRVKSTNRILKYLQNKKAPLKILDLGCGNGWFSNHLSKINNSVVLGVDMNPIELEQANRIFLQKNLTFVYADIFKAPELNSYDIITINSCIQYFENIDVLINALKEKLNKNGEIHILDSPFYKANEIKVAKERTVNYYTALGFPEMGSNYFHHSINQIKGCDILYNPKKSLLSKIRKDIPFPWIRLR